MLINVIYVDIVYDVEGKIGHWLYQHRGIFMASNLPSVGHVSVGSRDTWSNLPCPPGKIHFQVKGKGRIFTVLFPLAAGR